MNKKIRFITSIFLAAALLLSGCFGGQAKLLDPKSPTVITVWHAYNAYAKSVFDQLIVEFNETVGADMGIIVDSYGYGDYDKLSTAVFDSVNGMIGSEPLPDIFTAYPDSAYQIDSIAPLVPLDVYFSKEELESYRSEFLQEGNWGESGAYKMIPVAKSTEVLYLNRTDWDKFASAKQVSIDELSTWEGLARAAQVYYEWTGGKAMIGFNAFNDFQELTAVQLQNEIFSSADGKNTFCYDRNVARKVWELCYVPHIKGYYKSSIYNQDGIKSGDMIAYIGSSAGAGYFPDQVTVNAGRVYPISCEVLQYPTFETGKPYMGQRGANMCITASDKKHQYASAEFLKWITAKEQNLRFTVATGYIPVKKEALNELPQALKEKETEQNKTAIVKSVETAVKSMNKRAFYSKIPFENSHAVYSTFSNSIFEKIQRDLEYMEIRIEAGEQREDVTEELVGEENFDKWYTALDEKISGQLK